MDLDPDEIDIQLRTPAEVGRRMIALGAVAHLVGSPAGEHTDEDLDAADEDGDEDERIHDLAGERFDWAAWLTQEHLVESLSSSERLLLSRTTAMTPPGGPDGEATGDADEEGAAEALGALAWAVERSELTVLDRGYPYLELLDLVPSPWDDTASFLTSLSLRLELEIASARESAEILCWRAQVEIERRQAAVRDRSDIEAAIRDVAAEAGATGVASIGADGDLSIAGESIRSLSDPVILSMAAAARSRLRAMNWLCGLGDWDDPALTDI